MINNKVREIRKLFEENGFQIRIVGGAVRDYVLGVKPKDIDFCTDATPSEMLAMKTKFKVLPTGIEHGTVSFVVKGQVFEITTLRVDIETDGRHAKVEFTRSFEEDATRRDLTINAMSMDFDSNVYDYFGGKEDLENNIVRFVGNVEDRIKEDYLRILRFFRFATRFNAKMDMVALEVIAQNVSGLKQISVERWWMEMEKTLSYDNANEYIQIMYAYKVMEAMGFSVAEYVMNGTDPVGKLSTMITSSVHDFNNRWKMSKYNARKIEYLIKNRDTYNITTMKNDLVNGVPMDYVKTLNETYTKPRTLMQVAQIVLNKFEIPIFPVTGKDAEAIGFTQGVEMGNAMRKMKEMWVASGFIATKEELIAQIS